MKWLNVNKFHCMGLLTVVVLFIITVQLRRESLSVPLSRHHEWITAHTLITCEIWEKNGGPSAYHFSPVYTYPGEGNQKRRALGGVVDSNGDVYYVSYPPFAFIFAYYATSFLGGPDTDSIRVLSLSIHLFCGLLIYLIALLFAGEENKNQFSIAGVIGAFLYLFSTGNLWAHGNLYFADMLVQLFVISGIYLLIRFYQKRYRRELLMLCLLSVCFFLATYTEWLGLFLSFFAGTALLAVYFFTREFRFIKAFLAIGISASMALGLTVWQYSSIAGWEQFKEVSLAKYDERSGHESQELTPNAFTLDNDEAYHFMISRVDQFYKMAENFVGICGIILLVLILIPNTRRRMDHYRSAVLAVSLLGVSILLHYMLFFNFNSLHDFSSLKTGFLFILLVTVFIALSEAALPIGFRALLFAALAYLGVTKGIDSVNRYYDVFPIAETDWNRMETGAAMRELASPNQAVFTNISANPELVYAAGHNVFPLTDTSQIGKMMMYYENDSGQYYHHLDSRLTYVLEFRMQNDKPVFYNRININSDQGTSGSIHQK